MLLPTRLIPLLVVFATPAFAHAQQPASIIYRLGRDTVAIEQYSRTATRLAGELVTRSGVAVARVQYDIALDRDGRATSATIRRRQADGSPIANTPTEWRFTFTRDSARREAVWPDSTQSRAFAAASATPILPAPAYAHLELLSLATRRGGVDTVTALGINGNPTRAGIARGAGDTLRLIGGVYPVLLKFDGESRLQSVDGTLTTNKIVGTRGQGGLDIAAIAQRMTPTGVLSARATARATVRQGGIVMVDYGRPMVRERTVWGGTLVPFDSVWRTGANDATHLATSRELAFGDVTVPSGVYTLWVQHARTGTTLLISRQVGVWGTVFDAAQVLGRVPLTLAATPEHVEEFTITVRSLGMNRGALDLAWGPSVATAMFVMR